MKASKHKDSKCRCNNCFNTATRLVEMESIRLWLCEKCRKELIKILN